MIVKCASTECNFEVISHNSRFLLREMEKRQTNKSALFSHLIIRVRLYQGRKYHRIVRSIRNTKTGDITPGAELGYIDSSGNYYDTQKRLKGIVTDKVFAITTDGYL